MGISWPVDWKLPPDWWMYQPEAPLLFNSGLFAILFTLFFTGFVLFRRTRWIRALYTIGFSLFFYYKCSGFYAVLLLLSTLIDFIIGILMEDSREKWLRRLLLFASLLSNLGMMMYFKYTNFLIANLNASGLADWPFFDIFLPVGISFFTFQTLSYSIDVYRGHIRAERDLLDFAFYVTYFPQLVAGPIVRAADFLPQLKRSVQLDRRDVGTAILLIGNGLIKKAVISDYISVNFVDRVFESPAMYSGLENQLAIYGYAIQIYCDFSGYSDIAIGLARLMGFRLPVNFEWPYRASSITEFWRRWHISLSSWLRDYLYISMGGNRKGNGRTYVHLFITMLLGGLWHGASWTFVGWGAFHGIWLMLERIFKGRLPKLPAWAGVIWCFHLVCLGWMLFRAEDTDRLWQQYNQIVHHYGLSNLLPLLQSYWKIFALMGIGLASHLLSPAFRKQLDDRFIRSHWLFKAFYLAAVWWLMQQMATAGVQPYIYFQF